MTLYLKPIFCEKNVFLFFIYEEWRRLCWPEYTRWSHKQSEETLGNTASPRTTLSAYQTEKSRFQEWYDYWKFHVSFLISWMLMCSLRTIVVYQNLFKRFSKFLFKICFSCFVHLKYIAFQNIIQRNIANCRRMVYKILF